MPPSWRAGLVNAFPIPDDKRKKKKRGPVQNIKGSSKTTSDPASSATGAAVQSPPIDPFPFLQLPPEIRTKIYHLILFPPPPSITRPRHTPHEIDPNSLAFLRTCALIHSETTHLLYTHTPFPLFPIQTFPPLPTPLLIPPRHRPLLKSLHLRLGNSWTSPPRTWRVSKLLSRALPKFTSLITLKTFIEVDPSDPLFEKYRVSRDFYTDFAGELLREVLGALPQLERVEVGGYAFVDVKGPLVRRVRNVLAEVEGLKVVWSEENGWRERMKEVELRDR